MWKHMQRSYFNCCVGINKHEISLSITELHHRSLFSRHGCLPYLTHPDSSSHPLMNEPPDLLLLPVWEVTLACSAPRQMFQKYSGQSGKYGDLAPRWPRLLVNCHLVPGWNEACSPGSYFVPVSVVDGLNIKCFHLWPTVLIWSHLKHSWTLWVPFRDGTRPI